MLHRSKTENDGAGSVGSLRLLIHLKLHRNVLGVLGICSQGDVVLFPKREGLLFRRLYSIGQMQDQLLDRVGKSKGE
jgi:hypothetical protein